MQTPTDGSLFEIKHLLIIREQIAPFQVDFTIKELNLDFQKMKNAGKVFIFDYKLNIVINKKVHK